jgi:hypothetical protein
MAKLKMHLARLYHGHDVLAAQPSCVLNKENTGVCNVTANSNYINE